MKPSPPLDDPLAAHFAGKRRWKRVAKTYAVRLQGASAAYEGKLLDVSPGGLWVAVEDPSFYETEEDGLSVVQEAFPDGLHVTFPQPGLTRHAEVVRVTPHLEGLVSLGCRFDEPLTDAEAAVLDVAAAQVDAPEALLEILPWQARPEWPLSILLFASADDTAGPRHLAQVVAAAKRVVEARLLAPGLGALDVARDLEEAPLLAVIAHGRSRLWAGEVQLLTCAAGPDEPVELRLLASKALGRSVLRRMSRARDNGTA